jgi:serine/threonine-protein kinase
MLTGRYVFTADSAIQIVARHVHTPPVPPSRHSAYPMSTELEQIVLTCLRKKPSERPATARELCDQLGRCAVESQWTREDARMWWETRMAPETPVPLGT